VLAVRNGQTMLAGPATAAAFSGQVLMDNNGRLLYNLQLAGAGVTAANDQSLWLFTPGSGNTLVLREGDPAPGTAGGTFSNGAGDWRPDMTANGFTRNGKYSFVADISGGNATPGVNDRVIYVGTVGGSLSILSRRGDPAPGTDGVFAQYNPIYVYVADSGRTVLPGDADRRHRGPGQRRRNLGGHGGSGDPGRPGGVSRPRHRRGQVRQHDRAQHAYSDFGIVFDCNLLGGDVVRSTNNRAVFAWTPTQGTFLVARGGESMQVVPGVFKTTSLFGAYQFGNTDGAALGLSHTGKLTTNAFFDLASSAASVATVDLNCAPTTDYYLDADHDGHGDPTTEINLCAGGVPPAGYITTSGDCLDSNASALGQSPETCNGIDDDCDARIDEGIPIPSAPLTMTLAKVSANTVLSWAAVPGATGYDVVSGDLAELRSAQSFQFLSQAFCVGDDLSGPTYTSSSNPTPGNGTWWIMRPLNCDGDGTYNDGSPRLHASRDTEIGASIPNYSCP
jgi:hypothetical protein